MSFRDTSLCAEHMGMPNGHKPVHSLTDDLPSEWSWSRAAAGRVVRHRTVVRASCRSGQRGGGLHFMAVGSAGCLCMYNLMYEMTAAPSLVQNEML